MHIRPPTLALYFKAQVLRRLPAQVELAHHRPERFFDVLLSIRRREEQIGTRYVQGRMSARAVIREANTLMSLRNALYRDVGRPGAPPMFNDELSAIVRTHIAPALKTYPRG